jgi:cytochrome oxidase Cu insertion factor (SCO1/SenC/PrrC family)
MTDLPSPERVKRGRMKLLLLAAFFALPVVGGWLAYTLGWAPGTTGNYGELLQPAEIPDPVLSSVDGRRVKLSALRGRWVMIAFDVAACDAYCERKLYFMRQARRALGPDMHRVERVWVLSDAAAPAPALLAAIEGTHVVRAEAGLTVAFPAQGSAADHIYLVDPLGNLMMRFPRDPDPGRIIKDLQRLLKYSSIG